MSDFFSRLRERKLVQWALAYIAAAFALIQVADIVAQRFGWPEQAIRFVIVALGVGFFLVLVLAWYHGERGRQRVNGTELLILALLLGIGGVAIWRLAPEPATKRAADKSAASEIPRKSIAVLPFDSLSEEKDNAYFASGMQDMILTKLAGIGDLKVISRTSTEKYKSRPDNLKDVGRELGVATILEGSVQKSGKNVLINVQLINAADDSHLWAQDYPRTLENIFGVEGEVAQKIAEALQSRLTADEKTSLATKPTQNAEALQAYLRGLDMQRDISVPMIDVNEQFQKAVTLDPDFVLAWTEVIWQRLRAYWFGFDATESNIDLLRTALERVTKLAPESPHVERAKAAYLYFMKRDFPGALETMKRVQRGLPNDARTWFFTALIERRAGLFDEAVAHMHKAQSLDPKDDFIMYELPNTALARHRFDEVIALLKQIPNINIGALELQLFAEWNIGGLDAGEPVLASMPKSPLSTGMHADQAMLRRDFRAASALYAQAIDEVTQAPSAEIYQAELFMAGYLPIRLGWELRQARCETAMHNNDAAKKLLTDVRDRAQAALLKKPVNLNIEAAWRATLALALAGLGERDAAVTEATKATQLIPESVDVYEGPYWLDTLAAVYAINGDTARAVPLIRHLVDTPGSMTTRAMLALDPLWDPIRADPGFKALVDAGAKP
jgi:TolB-like protein/tetratricopeptide (TPR) repeat protein